MKIDAHQHFWSLARGDYGWLTPALGPIHRDFGPADLAPLRRAGGVERTILVQAAATAGETDWLLEIAAREASVAGVVGWAHFDAVDAPQRVAERARNPLIVGLRPMMQDLADDDWMLGPRPAAALAAMTDAGLVFDALVKPRHLSRLVVLADRHPRLSIVLDHAGKPDIAGGTLEPWRSDIAALARRPNVVAKLSGLVTEAAPGWHAADLQPFVAHLFDAFRPGRVLWGSDWPVVELAGGYARWQAAAEERTVHLNAEQRAAVFGGNAARLYLGRRGRA